jgi:hypothetical protein
MRAAPLGCGCSTTTLLAALITCASTLVALAVLALLVRLVRCMASCCRAPRRGVVLEFEDGTRREYLFVRRGWWARRWRREPEAEPLLR